MKSFATYASAISFFFGVALAQDTTATTPAPSATPSASSLIPTGISSECSTFLTRLNSAADLTKCLNDLVDATAAFSPTSGNDVDQAALTEALAKICTSGCDASKIRVYLADFYTACSDELVGDNAVRDLITLYDVTYTLIPLQGATCAKDPDTNKYCVQQITVVDGNSTDITGAKAVSTQAEVGKLFATSEQVKTGKEAYVYPETDKDFFEGITKRQENSTDQSPLAILPDTAAYRSSGLVYLFISPTLPANQLCTKCTQQVLSSYVEFEASTPYAMGLRQSPILGSQSEIWTSVTEKCGMEYVNSILADAEVQTSTTDGDVVKGLNAGTHVAYNVFFGVAVASIVSFFGF